MNDDGTLPPAPARLVDNAETWLAFTDLCFIDPVGCGLSRLKKPEPAPGAPPQGKPEDDGLYWSVEKDLSSLCAFVDAFLSREKRWSSPVCIAGESYGGYRVGRLARMLQEKAGVGLSAAYLISPVIEWDSLFASRFVPLRFMSTFPSFVAAAAAHRKTTATREEAEAFAVRELVPALTPGGMGDAAREKLYPRIARLTGLDAGLVRRLRALAKRITLRHYADGHMFYSRKDAREAFFRDVSRDFGELGFETSPRPGKRKPRGRS